MFEKHTSKNVPLDSPYQGGFENSGAVGPVGTKQVSFADITDVAKTIAYNTAPHRDLRDSHANTIVDLFVRLAKAEQTIASLQSEATTLAGQLSTAQSQIASLQSAAK
jgi:hypothetical protein